MKYVSYRVLTLNTLAGGKEYRLYGQRPTDYNWEMVDVFGTEREIRYEVGQLIKQGYIVYDLGGYAHLSEGEYVL